MHNTVLCGNIGGIWKGILKSSYNSETIIDPFYIMIDVNGKSIKGFSSNSTSESFLSQVICTNSGNIHIDYMSKCVSVDRPPSLLSAFMDIKNDNSEINGEYFTNKNTNGTFRLTEYRMHFCRSFKEAEDLFDNFNSNPIIRSY